MTKEELREKLEELKNEIETINIVVSIGEHEGIKLITDDIKKNCVVAIESDNFSKAKKQIKEIEIIKSFIGYIEEKKELVTEKQNEIENLQNQLDNWQIGLFEKQFNAAKKPTGTTHNEKELYTGDIFESRDKNHLLISTSEKEPNNFVILHSTSDTELLLQYPKNREALKDTAYLGNLYDDEKLQEIFNKTTSEANSENNNNEEQQEGGK